MEYFEWEHEIAMHITSFSSVLQLEYNLVYFLSDIFIEIYYNREVIFKLSHFSILYLHLAVISRAYTKEKIYSFDALAGGLIKIAFALRTPAYKNYSTKRSLANPVCSTF